MTKCVLYSSNTVNHVSQICTGYSLLEKKGIVKISQNLGNYSKNGITPFSNVNSNHLQGMFVEVDDKLIYYDCGDGPEIREEAASIADFYFKRSYLEEAIPDTYKSKVFRLGLNYAAYRGITNKHEFAKYFFQSRHYGKDYKDLIKYILSNTPFGYLPTIKNMHVPPDPNQEPKVIFMVRAWENLTYGPEITQEEADRRNLDKFTVTETWAAIIRLLRKELGDRFYGGFSHTPYAVKNYKNELLDQPDLASKKNYMSLLKNYPIGIASTGIFGSIGKKFTEYISLSKAVVSEKLNYEVPGDIAPGKNYYEFITADECVAQTMKLVEDKALREEMMENNRLYYENFLRPDKFVQRTLNIILTGKE